VNEIRPYEQLMAAKLDQITVPDMSDAVWAGIEEQLDAPPGEPGAGDGSGFKVSGWWGLFAVAVVVGLLFWYFGRKGVVSSPPSRALPTQQAPVREDSVGPAESVRPGPVGSRKPAGGKSIPVVPVDSLSFQKTPVDSALADSSVRQVAPPVKVDSGFQQRNRPALPDADLYTTPPVLPPGGRKHKGVKGITDDDYKISAGKDSGRKRN
jgi:hypothetical protein